MNNYSRYQKSALEKRITRKCQKDKKCTYKKC